MNNAAECQQIFDKAVKDLAERYVTLKYHPERRPLVITVDQELAIDTAGREVNEAYRRCVMGGMTPEAFRSVVGRWWRLQKQILEGKAQQEEQTDTA
jgi:hypothetical protein